jgi:isopenicillin N synthase-like dioxygenase
MFGTDRAAIQRTAARLHAVCRDIGFFYIVNHRVPGESIARAVRQCELFYALPLASKTAYDVARLGRHRGYVPATALTAGPDAKTPDLQEGYEVGLELPADDPDYLAGNMLYGPNLWPRELPDFGADIYRYFEAILQLGHVVFRAFAVALGLPDGFFEDKIDKPMAQLRLIYYPPQERVVDDIEIGVGTHTDYECFTILWQGAPGLQVRSPDGVWVEAPPVPESFVINIGDMMQRWTNDLFISTPHRVINTTGRARYSLPFFFGANYEAVVEPLPSCTGRDNPPRYPPTKCGYWTETMHTLAYVYRRADRGKVPNPELPNSGVPLHLP